MKIGKRAKSQNNCIANPAIIFVLFPDNKFAGKLIKYGNGVKYIHDFMYSGNVLTGASNPEKNNVGINKSLSIEEAFSVQKQRHAIIDWIKNCIKKDKKVEIEDKIKILKLGNQILSGRCASITGIATDDGGLSICNAGIEYERKFWYDW